MSQKDCRIKILMVCLGNICRSPLAQGILEKKLDPTKYLVASAGTANYHVGKSADIRSINVAKKNNIDISSQRAAQFNQRDFDIYDHIFAMDIENYNNILKLSTSKEDRDKVSLILNEINSDSDAEVPDPYYGGINGFDHVYNLLNEACSKISNRI